MKIKYSGPFAEDFENKLALHWAVDRINITSHVIRYLVKMNKMSIMKEAHEKTAHEDGKIVVQKWTPLSRAIEHGHFEIARYMMMITHLRDKKTFFKLNWEARKILIMSIRFRSRENEMSSCVAHLGLDHGSIFLKLYDDHLFDLFRAVVSFI